MKDVQEIGELDASSPRYAEAGVDIDTADRFIGRIRPLVSSTYKRGVITEIGGFAGLFALDRDRYQEPILVASTDGVGTKLKIAFMAGVHNTVGIDLVAMCVNDILVCGAQPLFFLDYFATGKLDPDIAVQVVSGIAAGCRDASCALIGGETAEMPGLYQADEYDLAGFVVGVVERGKIVDGSEIGVGHAVIALASSGLHSNGFSLVRKICFSELGLSLSDRIPELGDMTLGEVLLTPTRIYANTILHLLKHFRIHGMAHITGGGLLDNIPRVLPRTCKAVIKKGSWDVPSVFGYLQKKGRVTEEEMFRVFNNGIGMVLFVPEAEVPDLLFQVRAFGEQAWVIGRVEERGGGPPVVFTES